MENYQVLGWIGEGAHGVVLKARCITTNDVVALKRIPRSSSGVGFPRATLRY